LLRDLQFGSSGECSESFSEGTECKPVFDSYVGQPLNRKRLSIPRVDGAGPQGIASVEISKYALE
jgi:hypothetical protein